MIFNPVFGGPARPVGPAPVMGGLGALQAGGTPFLPNRGPMPGPRGTMGTFHKGGKVRKTGKYLLKKGEHVIPKKKKMVKLVALMNG